MARNSAVVAWRTGQPRTLTSRSSKKTAGNETKGKMEYLSAIPRVMMVTFHLCNERLIFISEGVPASEEVFTLTAELCSVNSSPSPLSWNDGIDVTFCVLCTCWHCYSFLLYWPVCTNTFIPWSNFNGRKSLPWLQRSLERTILWKLLKWMISSFWRKEINLHLTVTINFNRSMQVEKIITHRNGPVRVTKSN